MKIVLDLQGAQSHSRYRGIGRYTLSMARAFAVEAAHHEIWLALNGRTDAASLELLAQFEGLVPRERVVIDALPEGIAGSLPQNQPRIQLAAAAQARFFSGLQADCVWHSSLFEGWGDDFTAALGTGRDDDRHVATLYDLIPLLNPQLHLRDPAYRLWYQRRLALLKRCGLLLAISSSSRNEAIDALQLPPDDVAVVSGAADPLFRPMPADSACWARWQRQWGLAPGFALYAGGYDAHKNVETLLAAWAELPALVRGRHALVLAGRCDAAVAERLRRLGRKLRLPAGSVIFTGALDDDELARLYSSCLLFVAPSLHEGLGLPPLEAMACGAAVIGSNAASLPEVIGRADALFDPRSVASMAAKLHAALTEAGFLDSLREHAAVQTRKFSWPNSARRALAAIERHAEKDAARHRPTRVRPRLIYVSPLPPVRSGIADYSARLLRELDRHYAVEVVVEQPAVMDPWIQANLPVRSLRWFREHADELERVLYHFGNSPFHAHMFDMLQRRAGVVVLHDSWLGAARHWMAQQAGDAEAFERELYASHGYAALRYDLRHGRDATLNAWPVNRDVIDRALGVIVHSDYARRQAALHYGPDAAAKYIELPFPKERTHGDRRSARRLLGIDPADFVICSFGMLAPTKLNHRLLAAWLQSSLADDRRCHLLFVGENHGGDYGSALRATIDAAAGAARIRITGFVSAERYADHLAAADAVVQLRAHSRGETSAAIFDALAQGLPLIVNAHGTAAELPPAAVLTLPDHFSDAELAAALQTLRFDDARRAVLADAAAALMAGHHHPARVAERYRDAIEHFSGSAAAEEQRLLDDLRRRAQAGHEPLQETMLTVMAANRPRLDRPRIYVDVTATACSDRHTGIERVVRGVLSTLLALDQQRYRIEPVRLHEGRYVHAPRYALQLVGHPPLALPEDEVQPRPGDVLLGLDWVADRLPASTAMLDAWRVRGVRMLFVVYDLLPVLQPTWFPQGIADMHAAWLQCIGHYADGLLCISRSVAADLRGWFDRHPPRRRQALPLGYFYPGSDPEATRPSAGLPASAAGLLARLGTVPSFLMVGTIEPRKGHAFVLDAFERLWSSGGASHLVVVGRQGWMCDALAARLRTHAQAGARLVWLEQASDEYLERLYDSAAALVAASEAEGFGLPLVEAARRGLPVLARDIPVFREVAAHFAQFFDGADVASLVDALHAAGRTPGARSLPASGDAVVSWEQTVTHLWEMLGAGNHPQWLPAWSPAMDSA